MFTLSNLRYSTLMFTCFVGITTNVRLSSNQSRRIADKPFWYYKKTGGILENAPSERSTLFRIGKGGDCFIFDVKGRNIFLSIISSGSKDSIGPYYDSNSNVCISLPDTPGILKALEDETLLSKLSIQIDQDSNDIYIIFRGSKALSIYVYKDIWWDRIGEAPVSLSIVVSTPTFSYETSALGPTDRPICWDFYLATNKDIYCICRQGLFGHTCVSVLNFSTHYASLRYSYITCLGAVAEDWSFAVTPSLDILCFRRHGDQCTEIYCLDHSNHYSTFKYAMGTILPPTDSFCDFCLMNSSDSDTIDVVCINRRALLSPDGEFNSEYEDDELCTEYSIVSLYQPGGSPPATGMSAKETKHNGLLRVNSFYKPVHRRYRGAYTGPIQMLSTTISNENCMGGFAVPMDNWGFVALPWDESS